MSEMDSPAWPRHASSSAGCSSASARPEAIAWLMPADAAAAEGSEGISQLGGGVVGRASGRAGAR